MEVLREEGREVGSSPMAVEMDCVYAKEISPGTKHNINYSNGTQRK